MTRVSIGVLRSVIREIIKESSRDLVSEESYLPGTEETLMLDQPGMEKSQREKIRDYLRKIGMIK
tara:strand:+ start:414 stop:608 length:195 start_codon:yes stop_codon:yes gene_type:complete